MRYILICLFLLFLTKVSTQCPPETEVSITTQSKLQEFKDKYPDCQHYDGDILLSLAGGQDSSTDPIHDLSPLSNLVTISGKLYIGGDLYEKLLTFRGLDNLRKVGVLDLRYLTVTESMVGLESLDTIRSLTIRNTSLETTEQLTALIISSLYINFNTSLSRIIGLELIDNTALSVTLIDNPSLIFMGAIENLTTLSSLTIRNLGNYEFVKQLRELTSLSVWGDDDLKSLQKFENLEKVRSTIELFDLEEFKLDELPNTPQYNLTISNCPINNLDALTFTTNSLGINLSDLAELSSIEALRNLPTLTNLSITNCPNILNLSALENTNVERTLALEQLPLFNLQGLENVTSLRSLYLKDNPDLNDISGLRNIRSELNSITITGNSALDSCSIFPICNSLAQAFDISNNGAQCADILSLENDCGKLVPIKIFLDRNENGNYEDEPGISVGHFEDDLNRQIYPDENGNVDVYYRIDDKALHYMIQDTWKISTGTDEFTINQNTTTDTIYIGLQPDRYHSEHNISYTTTPVICDREYFYEITVANNGNTEEQIILQLLGFGTFLSSDFDYSENGDTIQIKINRINPGAVKKIKINYLAPSITEIDLGDDVAHSLSYKILDSSSNLLESSSLESFETFLCAYDPNDKNVVPGHLGKDHYVPTTEKSFDYTIRFQNTGNYYAQNLVITDTLSELLDPSSFRFNSSSHDISEIALESSAVSFRFDNIFLPDSTRDLQGSNGYVSFSASVISDIKEGEILDNTASIYFDSNPPIRTNTSRIIFKNDTSSTTDQNNDSRALIVYPTPSTNILYISDDSKLLGHKWRIINQIGMISLKGNIDESNTIDISSISKGIYYLEIDGNISKFIKL